MQHPYTAIAPGDPCAYDGCTLAPCEHPTSPYTARNRGNVKVGPAEWSAVTTARGQATCPPTCPLMGSGCYGENRGPGGTGTLFDNVADRGTAWSLEAIVAAVRDRAGWNAAHPRARMPRRLPAVFRANVVGDMLGQDGRPDRPYLSALSAAATALRAIAGTVAWSYTHAWRDLEPDCAGPDMVVRASCGADPAEVREAHAAGWYAAMVVPSAASPVLGTRIDGRTVVLCPATRAESDKGYRATCVDCRLCGQRAAVVAFPVHGARKRAAARAIATR